MIQRVITFFTAAVISMPLFWGCRKPPEFPPEPAITFKEARTLLSSQGKDSILRVTITFTDGDGDLGLKQEDTLAPFTGTYYYNMYAEYFELKNGSWNKRYYIEYKDSISGTDTFQVPVSKPIVFTYRVPYLEPKGKNKALQGEIDSDISTIGFADTCRFDIYIYDRALNKSNIVTTDPFLINAY
jgi:hypothetical protein